MDIIWLGHSCFRLRGKDCTVITDPFDPEQVGIKLGKQATDVVTVSHDHGDHNYVSVVKAKNDKEPFVISGPGEYEINGVHISGWKTYHDSSKGEERGKNTIYKYEVDGVNIVHLGDLGHELKTDLVDEIGTVDVLLIPVGGHFTINYQQAAKVVSQLEPGYVIPMHYLSEGLNAEVFGQLDGVEKFLHEMGSADAKIEPKLSVSMSDFPRDDVEIVRLEVKS